MALHFESDKRQAELNLRAHRVSFREATIVFADALSNTIPIIRRRKRALSTSVFHTSLGGLLVVSYTERGDRIRLIRARFTTGNEQRQYEGAN